MVKTVFLDGNKIRQTRYREENLFYLVDFALEVRYSGDTNHRLHKIQ